MFLIGRILKSLNFDDGEVNMKRNPVVKPPLHKDTEGPPRKHDWHYILVIGMLNYLEKSTQPEISYAVHQCTRFFEKKRPSHEKAVHRVGRYLLGTKENGNILSLIRM